MKKSEQIKALQAECDRLIAERDEYRKRLMMAHTEAKARRQDPPSLADQARSEFRQKWSWLLDAVGL